MVFPPAFAAHWQTVWARLPYISRPRPWSELYSHNIVPMPFGKTASDHSGCIQNYFRPARLAPDQQVLAGIQQGLPWVPGFQGFPRAGPATASCCPAAPASPALPPASGRPVPQTRRTNAASSARQVHPGRHILLPPPPRTSWIQIVLRSPPGSPAPRIAGRQTENRAAPRSSGGIFCTANA
jgi:hypothetical protein